MQEQPHPEMIHQSKNTTRRLENTLSRILLLALVAALVLLVTGLGLVVVHGESSSAISVPLSNIPGSLRHGDHAGILSLGLLLLLATPVVGVVTVVISSVRNRQWLTASAGSAVLLVLVASVAIAMTTQK